MDPKRFTRRLIALGAAMFLCALVFVVTLFDAQIVNGDDYLDKSIRTNAKPETVKASRGILTEKIQLCLFDRLSSPEDSRRCRLHIAARTLHFL